MLSFELNECILPSYLYNKIFWIRNYITQKSSVTVTNIAEALWLVDFSERIGKAHEYFNEFYCAVMARSMVF